MNEAHSASPRPVSSPDGQVPAGEGAGEHVLRRRRRLIFILQEAKREV